MFTSYLSFLSDLIYLFDRNIFSVQTFSLFFFFCYFLLPQTEIQGSNVWIVSYIIATISINGYCQINTIKKRFEFNHFKLFLVSRFESPLQNLESYALLFKNLFYYLSESKKKKNTINLNKYGNGNVERKMSYIIPCTIWLCSKNEREETKSRVDQFIWFLSFNFNIRPKEKERKDGNIQYRMWKA